MPPESETYEEKSEYSGTDKERLKLVKSIVAMANTRGGTIHMNALPTALVNSTRHHWTTSSTATSARPFAASHRRYNWTGSP